jgi:3-hydroxyisobutyrate dehydrogenase-like beta-hydroxyacid dehydrogenase
LSIVPPAEALHSAEAISEELRPMDVKPAYADCNAVAPQTAHQIGRVITAAGATFIDACIIGPPLREGASTRFYSCGPDIRALDALRDYGLEVKTLGASIGRASGLKMVYSASTKGATALWTQLLVAARLLGLEESLMEEFNLGGRQAAAYQQALGQLPPVPRNAGRWTGEMEEIASTFAALGLTPKMAEGAADLFRFIAGTPLSVENDGSNVPAETVLDELAGFLEARS